MDLSIFSIVSRQNPITIDWPTIFFSIKSDLRDHVNIILFYFVKPICIYTYQILFLKNNNNLKPLFGKHPKIDDRIRKYVQFCVIA